jgi:hypothetical protein
MPSSPTTIREPGACSAIQAIASRNPPSSLSITSVAIVAPFGVSISSAWVSRWVSPPITASTTSASIGIRSRISLSRRVILSAGLMESPNGISVMSHAPERGQASDQASGCSRPVSATGMTSPQHGTPQRPHHARVNPSHRHRILAAIHPEPLQTHSQIARWPSHITTPRTSAGDRTPRLWTQLTRHERRDLKMADDEAARQPRSRAHEAGNHRLCDPARCRAARVAPGPLGGPRPTVTAMLGRVVRAMRRCQVSSKSTGQWSEAVSLAVTSRKQGNRESMVGAASSAWRDAVQRATTG